MRLTQLPVIALLACLLAACGLPALEGARVESRALPADEAAATTLGRAVTAAVARQPAGHSGLFALRDPRDAFAARALLARSAERSLDLQYYIWNPDTTGMLMLGEMLRAAERGVRVRLLLDDNGIGGLDESLALLDAHPAVEVRIFNPLLPRGAKWLAFLYDFGRANRRMHNKSFTADGTATIVGGRNIGDEYFGGPDPLRLMDLDVLGVGPIATDVGTDFDRYWASASAYPLELLLEVPDAATQPWTELARRVHEAAVGEEAAAYLATLPDTALVTDLIAGRLALDWASVQLLSDDPAKGLGRAPPEGLLTVGLFESLGAAVTRLDLVSAYFVPEVAGTHALANMARRGVEVRVLTNSYAATDVGMVHAGYAKRRRALLEAGVTLFETRPYPGSTDAPPRGEGATMGSSSVSMHAKSFAVDGRLLFIGSFNFDPRSARLNTELGFLIDSPPLASLVHETLDAGPGDIAWQVRLDGEGELLWVDGTGTVHAQEPGIGTFEALGLRLLSMLPIDWLL